MNLRNTVVLGMHRAGTSAVAGCLHELGHALPRSEDLIVAPDNPQHFESRPLVDHNERLLDEHLGSWDVPASPNARGAYGPPSTSWTEDAKQILHSTFPTTPFVMKDPRLCLTLDAWRPVLDADTRVVLVVRRPDDVAASLQRRNQMTHTHALALWETYMWNAERACQSLSCFVLPFEQLRAEPKSTIDELADFVGNDSANARARAVSTLNESIGRSNGEDPHDLVAERARALNSLQGAHDALRSSPVPLADWATEHLEAIRTSRRAEVEARRARRRPVKIALAKMPGLRQLRAAQVERSAKGKSSQCA